MPTVTYLWDFADPASNLVDQGNNGFITASQNTGEPSIAITCTKKSIADIEFILSEGSVTWEDWGVPSGATITNVEVSSWGERLADNVGISNHSITLDIRDTAGTASVTTVSSIAVAVLPTTISASFNDNSASAVSVDAAYGASNTIIKLWGKYDIRTDNTKNTSMDWRLGNVDIIVTYTEASISPRRVFIVL